jgi:RNA polymerase sigma-70 factor (ECF subfamily)
VRALLRGDERAFDQLFREHVPRLFRIVLARIGRDPDAAEEVVQRTLIRALGKLATFRGEASLLTWLVTFARHEISSYYRQYDRAAERCLSDEAPEIRAALELLEDEQEDPERAALRGEVRGLVHETLERLPARYARVLDWKYLQGLSVKEIARREGEGPVVVQSVLARARVAFREAFIGVGNAAGLAGLLDERSGETGRETT